MTDAAPAIADLTISKGAQTDLLNRGLTVRDVARRFRVSEDKVRRWLAAGELVGVNTSTSLAARPRWVISRTSLAEFEQRRSSAPPPKPLRRRRRPQQVDFYPD